MSKVRKNVMNILWPIAFIAMVVFIAFSSVSIFNNFYYKDIFVEGESMNPTLSGNVNHANYGKMDTSSYIINHIVRFDIVITYFPNDDYEQPYDPTPGAVNKLKSDASYKIKRVYALPSETFSLTENDGNPVLTTYVSEQATTHPFDFNINYYSRTKSKTTLNDQQYFVMGDNWTSSRDSYTRGPIYKGNIVGVLHCIEGYGKINTAQYPHVLTDMVKENTTYFKRG